MNSSALRPRCLRIGRLQHDPPHRIQQYGKRGCSMSDKLGPLASASSGLINRVRSSEGVVSEIAGEVPAGSTTSERTSKAILDVVAERRRQTEVEGFSPDHDDKHDRGQLVRAAVNYAAAASVSIYLGRSHDFTEPPPFREHGQAVRWPWGDRWWKPGKARRMLVKAASLIIAEIERIDRSEGSAS
jgi:hypothetical protein